MRRVITTVLLATGLSFAVGIGPAGASSDQVVNGRFPIDDHFVLEPDGTICGFPITLDITGQGAFSARLDGQGLNSVVHVHERTVGTISANGIELRDFASVNTVYDFRSLTMTQVGLVFRDNFFGGSVVLMDRGRLIFNFDPYTGEAFGDPIFEAGPHPELHGDVGVLCAALTP
jgi:hypothetical protein